VGGASGGACPAHFWGLTGEWDWEVGGAPNIAGGAGAVRGEPHVLFSDFTSTDQWCSC
jgi:hypothetical protein